LLGCGARHRDRKFGLLADELPPALREVFEHRVQRLAVHRNILAQCYLVVISVPTPTVASARECQQQDREYMHPAHKNHTMRQTGCYSTCRTLVAQESLTSRVPADERTFWETYAPGNIFNQIKYRISRLASRRGREHTQPEARTPYDGTHARRVGEFYDARHQQFMKVYGDVIQALRTRDIVDLLNYQIKSIGFEPGQRVLDAGCGIAAPAIHFASRAGVYVDGITISNVQYEVARDRTQAAGLEERVRVILGDYHKLPELFSPGTYDIVYFLESFGHSRDKRRLIEAAWDVLKPGGRLYIKDLFRRVPLRLEHREPIEREIRKINESYHYEVSDLNVVVEDIRRKGFVLRFLRAIELELRQFEDLAISNEFQELTGLAQIKNWNDYIFPVDFFEIECTKPEFSLDWRLDRHFLQNRQHLHQETQASGTPAAGASLDRRPPTDMAEK